MPSAGNSSWNNQTEYFQGQVFRGRALKNKHRQPLTGNEALFATLENNTVSARSWLTANPGTFYALTTNVDTAETWQPVGGGQGYTDIILTGDHIVETADQLVTAAANATSGQIIFIPDTATIDLTGYQITFPNNNVTVASTRGYGDSEGALLTSDSLYPVSGLDENHWTFRATGTGVRFTGLRMRGPEKNRVPLVTDEASVAIQLEAQDCEIDNCEINGWQKWGILVNSNKDHKIHHNLIMNNTMESFGYGIWFKVFSSTVEETDISKCWGNIFSIHRHHIAAAGSQNSSYFAFNNYFISDNSGNHMTDRHGGSPGVAGHKTDIHHNVFYNEESDKFGGMTGDHQSGGFVKFDNNYYRGNGRQAGPSTTFSTATGNTTDFNPNTDTNIPTVTLSPAQIQVEADESFTITATGADQTGDSSGPIKSYIWQFENERTVKITASNSITLSYPTKGYHIVSCRAVNRFGIASLPRSCAIQVKASATIPALHDHLVDWWTFSSGTPLVGNFIGKTFTSNGSGTFQNNGKVSHAYNCGLNDNLSLRFEESEGFHLYDQDFTLVSWIYRVGTEATGRGLFGELTNAIFYTNWQIDNHADTFNWGIDPQNTWKLVICEYNQSTRTRTVYLDNVLAGSTVSLSSLPTYNHRYNEDFSINPSLSTTGINGRYAEVALYRRLLTSDERDWFWNSGNGRTLSDIS